LARYVGYPRVSGNRSNNVRTFVYRVDDPLKPAAHEIMEDSRADAAGFASGADDRDGARLEERLHRSARGALRTKRDLLFVGGRRSDWKGDLKHSPVQAAFDLEARVHEHVHHFAIVA